VSRPKAHQVGEAGGEDCSTKAGLTCLEDRKEGSRPKV